MKRVAISGYFDPIHVGHLELIERAKALGNYLIVIVNNDLQTSMKKGKPFMKQEERMKIVEAIKGVDEVFLSIDQDRTVCESLRAVKPDIFGNGGDRLKTGEGEFDIPEMPVCKECNIEIVDGLGAKVQSSSDLIKGAEENKNKS